jgi:hypothetical protein
MRYWNAGMKVEISVGVYVEIIVISDFLTSAGFQGVFPEMGLALSGRFSA